MVYPLIIGTLIHPTAILVVIGVLLGLVLLAALLYWWRPAVARCFIYGVVGMFIMALIGVAIGLLGRWSGIGSTPVITILFALGGLAYGVFAGASK